MLEPELLGVFRGGGLWTDMEGHLFLGLSSAELSIRYKSPELRPGMEAEGLGVGSSRVYHPAPGVRGIQALGRDGHLYGRERGIS